MEWRRFVGLRLDLLRVKRFKGFFWLGLRSSSFNATLIGLRITAPTHNYTARIFAHA